MLYDKAKAVSNSRLSFDIQEFENREKSFGQKVTLGVYVSELSFTDDDIQRIVDEVYIKYKTQYGKSARIWINVYHGGERYDTYYESAYNFCQSVYDLAWELCNDIGKGERDSFLEWRYDKWHGIVMHCYSNHLYVHVFYLDCGGQDV